jgi:hypothetical protein
MIGFRIMALPDDLTLPTPPFAPPRMEYPKQRQLCPEIVFTLSQSGLTIDTMAPYFGLTGMALRIRMQKQPELMQAFCAGLADLVAEAGHVVRNHVLANDLDAAKFVLRNKGGWTTPRDIKVSVDSGNAPPTIDGHVLDLAARHTALLDSPDPDAPDAEWTASEGLQLPPGDVSSHETTSTGSTEEEELKAMMA